MPKLIEPNLLAALEEACQNLNAAGHSVVAVVAAYDPEEAEFHTVLKLEEVPTAGVTDDHIVLDALREISTEWSEQKHNG